MAVCCLLRREGVAFARPIDEDLPHHVGRHLIEVSTVPPFVTCLTGDTKIGVVNQIGGLEAETRSLPADMTRGDLPQFAIGQFHQARLGLGLALPEAAEKKRYVAFRLVLDSFLAS